MEAIKVKELNWTTVSDWRELTISYINYFGHYVEKEDVDMFAEKQFKQIAKELDSPYNELEPILKQENAEFYKETDRIFEKYDGFSKGNPLLLNLRNLLKVPVVPETMKVAVV